jgi:hypothetical protein
MTIREFVNKHGKQYKITYSSLHRLIRLGALKENIHYTKSYRAIRSKIELNENKVEVFLKTGRAK